MNKSSVEYHESELRVALDASNPNRLIPDAGGAKSILDIGCGAGQTLVAITTQGKRTGVDIDPQALRAGRRASALEGVGLAAARGEQLPFRPNSFDFVYSRVALPYMDIPTALSEMRRVLQPGGKLWLTLHPIDIPLSQFARGNIKGKIYASYIVSNGIWFYLTGRTFRYLRGMCESFQTQRGLRIALLRAGFRNPQFTRTPKHFIVTAQV